MYVMLFSYTLGGGAGHRIRLVIADNELVARTYFNFGMFWKMETQTPIGPELLGLPELVPTNNVDGREHRIHLMPPSENRWKERSRTYPGIAQAMAAQWVPVLIDYYKER